MKMESQKGCVKNPMQNTEILKRLFAFCPKETLPSARLVCLQWFEESLDAFRRSHTIHTTTNPNQRGFLRREFFDSVVSAVTQPASHLQFDRKPIQNLSLFQQSRFIFLTDLPNPPSVTYMLTKLPSFLQNQGSLLRSLQVDVDVKMELIEDFLSHAVELVHLEKLKLIINLTTPTPLEVPVATEFPREVRKYEPLKKVFEKLWSLYLEIDARGVRGPELKRLVTLEWKRIFAYFPRVRELFIEEMNNGEALKELVNAIAALRAESDSVIDITRLELKNTNLNGSEFINEALLKIAAMNWPLTILNGNSIGVSQLLQNYPALESLSLATSTDPCTIHAPYLPQGLKTLRILPSYFGVNVPVKSYQFLENTPNLEILEIKVLGSDFRIFEDVDTKIDVQRSILNPCCVPFLTHFSYYHSNFFSVDELNCFSQWMKNLTTLALQLTDDSFSFVCSHWPNLRKLTVFSTGMLTDVGIIGLKRQEDNTWKEEGIAQLKYLNEFVLQSKERYDGVGKYAIEEGLLKMRHLHTFKGRLDKMVPQHVEDKLKAHIPDCKITTF